MLTSTTFQSDVLSLLNALSKKMAAIEERYKQEIASVDREIEAVFARQPQALFAIFGADHVVSFARQVVADQVPDIGVVFNNQYALLCHGSNSPESP